MRRASTFKQSDMTKVLRSFRDAGYPAPVIVIEPNRLTVKPVAPDADEENNPWD